MKLQIMDIFIGDYVEILKDNFENGVLAGHIHRVDHIVVNFGAFYYKAGKYYYTREEIKKSSMEISTPVVTRCGECPLGIVSSIDTEKQTCDIVNKHR